MKASKLKGNIKHNQKKKTKHTTRWNVYESVLQPLSYTWAKTTDRRLLLRAGLRRLQYVLERTHAKCSKQIRVVLIPRWEQSWWAQACIDRRPYILSIQVIFEHKSSEIIKFPTLIFFFKKGIAQSYGKRETCKATPKAVPCYWSQMEMQDGSVAIAGNQTNDLWLSEERRWEELPLEVESHGRLALAPEPANRERSVVMPDGPRRLIRGDSRARRRSDSAGLPGRQAGLHALGQRAWRRRFVELVLRRGQRSQHAHWNETRFLVSETRPAAPGRGAATPRRPRTSLGGGVAVGVLDDQVIGVGRLARRRRHKLAPVVGWQGQQALHHLDAATAAGRHKREDKGGNI